MPRIVCNIFIFRYLCKKNSASMKKSIPILLLSALLVVFASCGQKMPKAEETVPAVSDEEDPVPSAYDEEEEQEAEPARPPKTTDFYEALLDSFCNKHFSQKWPGRKYVPGSLRVENFSPSDENTDEVIGTFSFKGRLGWHTYKDREFRAFVCDDGNHEYHVTFERQEEFVKINGKLTTGSVFFVYDPDDSPEEDAEDAESPDDISGERAEEEQKAEEEEEW